MRKNVLAVIAFLALLGGVLAIASAAPIPSVAFADDKECDSSGKGSGDCNDSDDNSGHDDDVNDDHGGDRDDDSAAQTALAQPVGANEIRIIDERYVPNTITIEAGESVTFVNADDDEHTATGPGFDTGKMLPGERVTITFDKPGTFDFVCQFHPEMRGQVIVERNGSPVASPVASPASGTPAAQAAGSGIEIDIIDFAFEQSTLTVAPGTTVTWTNTGVAPHTVSGLPEDSGTIEPGGSFSYTFTEAGTFDYQCAFHPQMVGQVIVDPNAPATGS